MSCAYWIEEWVEAIRQRNEARDWAKILFREWNKLVRENERLLADVAHWKALREVASVRADDAGREGYEQGQREIEERRCETCVYEGEVVCLEIGGPYRKLTGLCGTCRAAGFRAYRDKR